MKRSKAMSAYKRIRSRCHPSLFFKYNDMHYAGTDKRGFYFVGYIDEYNDIKVIAGCHNFSIRLAHAWWSDIHYNACSRKIPPGPHTHAIAMLDEIARWGETQIMRRKYKMHWWQIFRQTYPIYPE